MRHVAAYLLLQLAGSEPSKAGIESILSAVGIEADGDSIDHLMKAMEGKVRILIQF